MIVLAGAGRAFCAGYDLKEFAEKKGRGSVNQDMPWDPMQDYRLMKGWTDDFFAIWRSYKPVICKVHGFAVAGGSDIALCCDLLVMAEDARIGYMPTRVWGCPTTAMWTYRLGPARAKQMMFTGDVIDGRTAAAWGLANLAVPADELEAALATHRRQGALATLVLKPNHGREHFREVLVEDYDDRTETWGSTPTLRLFGTRLEYDFELARRQRRNEAAAKRRG